MASGTALLDPAVLAAEIEALRLANQGLEARMLAEAEHAEAMLVELEQQRNALRAAHRAQQNLSSFVQRVMDSAGSVLVVLDPEGRIRSVNRRCERVLGRLGETLTGGVLDDLLVPEERATLAEGLPVLPWPVVSPLFEWINRRGVYKAEHRLLAADGGTLSFLLEAEVLHDAQGKQEGAVVSGTDITELKRHEARLRRSESLLKEAQEQARMGSWELDLRQRKLSWSEEAHRIFEVPIGSDSDPYRDFFASIHPDDRGLVNQAFADSLRRRESFAIVHRLLLHDGRVKWVQQRGTHRHDDRGRPLRSVGTVQDIDDHYHAEQQLRIAATAFDAQEGMFITDADAVVLRVNKSFSEITGYDVDEIVGRTPRLLRSGRHDEAFYRAMWDSVTTTGRWQGEIWNRRKSGEIYPQWLMISAVRDGAGRITHFVATMTDITERKQAEDEIRTLAFYDPLTRLPNRRLLMDRLQQALVKSARSRRRGALLFIDLDNFKTLNDTLGHDMGDLLLQQVGQRLSGCVRQSDTVARLGGDEFVVMMEDLSTDHGEAAQQTETVGEKILAELNRPYELATRQHTSTPSIGATVFSGHESQVDDLLKEADLAMYKAKTSGRNALRFFDPAMQAAITARVELETDLRRALGADEFVLHYQAQMERSGRALGAEVLVRWRHPHKGMISPGHFIPIAEETGLIQPLGDWVMRTACLQLGAWARDPALAHLTLAVNVSARQLSLPNFVDTILGIITETGAPPERLKLELTESLVMGNTAETIRKMNALRDHGVSFSLDDFGTGFSSLSYLKRLPFDQVKIDQSFVRDILSDPNDAVIAETIIALGRSLGLAVIAEGVETAEQRDFLATIGCRYYQGYLFGRPGPLGDFESMVTQHAVATLSLPTGWTDHANR